MLYSDKIPVALLQSENTAKFVKVLDELQIHKEGLIHKANRFYNPVLHTGIRFLLKTIEQFGWPQPPAEFPKHVLDKMILNAGNVFNLKGSKLGLEYFLRVLTCGEITIDDSDFYPIAGYIIPGDVEAGYLFTEADYPNDTFYLFSGEDSFLPRFLTINIVSPYWNYEPIKDYIAAHINKFLPFVDENTTVTINYSDGPFVLNPHAFYYFEGGAPEATEPLPPPSGDYALFFWGWSSSATVANEAAILGLQKSDYFSIGQETTVDFRDNLSPRYLIYAEPLTEPIKTKWFANALSFGDINSSDLFRVYGNVGSFRVYISNYPTQQSQYPITFKLT